MISGRMILPALLLICVPGIAFAQNKDNKALQQLKDTKQSSQDAAGTRNPEAAKAKSNQGFDTAQPPSVRAGTPSTQTKAERDAAAIKAYTSKPATGTTQIQAIQRKKLAEPPSPVTAATTPAKAAPTTAPAKIAAPSSPAKPTTPVAAAPARPAPVATAPARTATPVATAPVKPSTTTFTTSSAPSPSSSSSSASKPSSSSSKK